MTSVASIYQGSDPLQTRRLVEALLDSSSSYGSLAVALFRAQKASAAGKRYRGRFRRYSMNRKNYQLEEIVRSLQNQERIAWGWGLDPATRGYPHVLYVDLPDGQVSFHASARGSGPDYYGKWDGVPGVNAARICAFCERVLRLADPETIPAAWDL